MSNKIKSLVAVALLSAIGLTACNKDVHAKPSNYDNPIVSFTDSKDEIYHNVMSIIEDAYRDGSLASAVLDQVLYQYSVSVFGRYNAVTKPYNVQGTTLKAAAKAFEDQDFATVDAFVDAHKAYWTTDNDGNRITTDEAKNSERTRVHEKWEAIEARISRNLYAKISGGSYAKRGYFSEKAYLKELRSQLHKVANPYDSATIAFDYEDKIVITPDVQEENVFVEKGGYLHRENYQQNYTTGATESLDANKVTYIEDEIIPTIYRSLLVEQYILDESYNTLGRSYARKVNVITVSPNSNNDKAADYLMKYFVRNVISIKGAEITLDDFKAVSNAVKGVTPEAQAYLEAVNAQYAGAFPKVEFEGFDGGNYSYYVGTDYGDMMADFAKIKKDIALTDTSIESDFTGSGTYTADIGKEIKENNIKTKDYTTDGWFIKNGGLSDLPESIKSRLFNIGVANVLDGDAEDRFAGETYKVPANENKLVAKINGAYYLKVASKQSGAQDEDDILFYEGGKYYVVQIEEAVSGSKLAKEATKYTSEKKEEIINEVCRIVASNDTYQTLSTKHWLEQAAIQYHDTTVYDYFKTNYPELFPDDDKKK